MSESRVIVPPAPPIPSMAEQLDLRHLQAALEIAIELDRVNHLQAPPFKMENSSFVVDVAKPVVAETEMSFMVERIPVPVPCTTNQVINGFGAGVASTREPVEECPPIPQSSCTEETPEDVVCLISLTSPLPYRQPEEKSEDSKNKDAPSLRARSAAPSPSSLPTTSECPSAPMSSPDLTIPTDAFAVSQSLSLSNLAYSELAVSQAAYLNPDILLSVGSPSYQVNDAADVLDGDVFSSGRTPTRTAFTPYAIITPSSSSVTLDFDEYLNFSPDAKKSPIRSATPTARLTVGLTAPPTPSTKKLGARRSLLLGGGLSHDENAGLVQNAVARASTPTIPLGVSRAQNVPRQ